MPFLYRQQVVVEFILILFYQWLCQLAWLELSDSFERRLQRSSVINSILPSAFLGEKALTIPRLLCQQAAIIQYSIDLHLLPVDLACKYEVSIAISPLHGAPVHYDIMLEYQAQINPIRYFGAVAVLSSFVSSREFQRGISSEMQK